MRVIPALLITFGLVLCTQTAVMLRQRDPEAKIAWIWFTSHRQEGRGIFRMQPDGRDMELIAEGDYWGLRVAGRTSRYVMANGFGADDIIHIDTRTLEQTPTINLKNLNLPDDDESLSSLSPDGQWYVIVGAYNPNGQSYASNHLYVIRTNGDDFYEIPITQDGAVNSLTWQDNSRYLWFTERLGRWGDTVLRRFDVQTRALQTVDMDIAALSNLQISPNGHWIAYWVSEDYPVDLYFSMYHLEIIPITGGPPQRILTTLHSPVGLDWSPDSEWLLYTGWNYGCDFYTLKRDGSTTHHVGSVECYHHGLPDPRWSTDGEWVLWADAFGSTNIHRATIDGSIRQNLTHGEANDRSPIWVEWSRLPWREGEWFGVGGGMIALGIVMGVLFWRRGKHPRVV